MTSPQMHNHRRRLWLLDVAPITVDFCSGQLRLLLHILRLTWIMSSAPSTITKSSCGNLLLSRVARLQAHTLSIHFHMEIPLLFRVSWQPCWQLRNRTQSELAGWPGILFIATSICVILSELISVDSRTTGGSYVVVVTTKHTKHKHDQM